MNPMSIPQAPVSRFDPMTSWFKTPLGKVLLAQEKRLLEGLLARRFGYHLLQLGCSDIPMYDSSPINHKFSLALDVHNKQHMAVASTDAIPLSTNSIDLVLLHHALDYSDNQHQLLREASRILIAGGHMLIVGFNPLSTWGIRNRMQRRQGCSPWNAHQLTALRVTDWLKLLEFQIESIHYGLYCLPFNKPRLIRYSAFGGKLAGRMNWPTGAVYVISAKKQVAPLTPIHTEWRRFPVPVGIPAAENIRGASKGKASAYTSDS